MKRFYCFSAIFVLLSTSAFAYIGPGAGLGAIITFAAIVLGLLLLIVGFLWYPLKRMLKKRRQTKTMRSAEGTPENRDH